MNNSLFINILMNIKNNLILNVDINKILNLIEEYIEWFELSKVRFCVLEPEYKNYLDILITHLKDCQCFLLLKETDKANDFLDSIIRYYKRLEKDKNEK